MRLGPLDTGARVLVVAEIGNNHEGDFATARKLVRAAAECGVDAVKFQTFKTEEFVSRADPARFGRLKSFELSFGQFEELARLARSLGLAFLSTPLDLTSARFLDGIVDAFKIASGDNNLYPLLDLVAATGKPVVLSTGLCGLEQVRASVAFLRDAWARRGASGSLALLHCVSSYPVAPEYANLRAIEALAEAFPGTPVGYSDHTVGIDAAVLSAALGARIIEKHFTLANDYSSFRDHALSSAPPAMKELVAKVRAAETLLGPRSKTVQACERALIPVVRRSAAAARALPAGHRLCAGDLLWLRPSGGLAPGEEAAYLGRALARAVGAGELLRPADFA